MEVFHGAVHIPGASEAWDLELGIDWDSKQVSLDVPCRPSGIREWEGLMVQVIPRSEAVFRTKGMGHSIAHWWHVVRNRDEGLSLMTVGLPDEYGNWMQCTSSLDRGELPD